MSADGPATILHLASGLALIGGGGAIMARLIPPNLRPDADGRRAAAAAAVRLDRMVALPAALLLALSAAWRVRAIGWAAADGWLRIGLILAILAALLWLGAGARVRLMAAQLDAEAGGRAPAADRYRGLFALWFLLAWPALVAAALALAAALLRLA